VGFHALIGKATQFVFSDKVQFKLLQLLKLTLAQLQEYYAIRTALGVLAALSCTFLITAVERKFGVLTSGITLALLAASPGMYISASSASHHFPRSPTVILSLLGFLPSSFAMYCLTAALAAWMTEKYALAELLVGLAAIVGWPFAALVAVPLGIDIVHKRGIIFPVLVGVATLLLVLGPTVAVDYYFYGKLTVAPWNIVDYNILSKHLHGGSELYGVEPWYYYVLNCFLNFNIMALAALCWSPLVRDFILPLSGMTPSPSQMQLLRIITNAATSKPIELISPQLKYTAGFYLWFGYMSLVPHKEERFMFVVYPQLCVTAAVSLTSTLDIIPQKHRVRSRLKVWNSASQLLPRSD